MTPDRSSPSELLPAIRRARIDSLDIYEVSEYELALLERGSPDCLFLNFAIFLLTSVTRGEELRTGRAGIWQELLDAKPLRSGLLSVHDDNLTRQGYAVFASCSLITLLGNSNVGVK
jgi:hypothetical protein